MIPLLLDHIVILLPYKSLLSPPPSLTKHFTITPGGRHADNRTENKLILFKDGSYIELIAFINDDPKLKEGHWWGAKEPGIIDFAFTTAENVTVLFSELSERLEKADLQGSDGTGEIFGYENPRDGGRKRDDGEELKWKVTFPKHVVRGELPFFCHDVTDRSLRVPGMEENTTHPSDVYGVRELCIMVPENRIQALVQKYEAVFGIEALDSCFQIHSVNPRDGVMPPMLFVQSAVGDMRQKMIEERGHFITDLVVGGLQHVSLQRQRIDRDLDLGRLWVDL